MTLANVMDSPWTPVFAGTWRALHPWRQSISTRTQAEDWFTKSCQSDQVHNANDAGKRDALEPTSDGREDRHQHVIGGPDMEKVTVWSRTG